MTNFRLFSAKSKPYSRPSQDQTVPDNNVQSTVPSPHSDVALKLDATQDERQELRFENLGIASFLCDALQAMSIHKPTDVQRGTIPAALQGRNVIASAKTGQGKTLCFALPIVQKLSEDPFGIFALVLTPTRELAFQIAEQFRIIGTAVHLRLAVVVGGMDMVDQALQLSKKPHVVIATPGRFVDHLRSSRDDVYLKKLQFLVLDEADRLLDDTFADDLAAILAVLPKKRQTLLYSATMTSSIERIRTPSTLVFRQEEHNSKLSRLEHQFMMTPSLVRDAYFVHLLRSAGENNSVIIFTNKCKTCELLRVMLRNLDIRNTALHSKMPQAERIQSLAKFRSGYIPVLLTTDVGSRGLDIPTVQLVINYDIPCNATDYVHRVGRTARAGRGGRAVSLVTEMDVNLVLNLEKKLDIQLKQLPIDDDKVNETLNEVATAKREASLQLIDAKFNERDRINKLKAESIIETE